MLQVFKAVFLTAPACAALIGAAFTFGAAAAEPALDFTFPAPATVTAQTSNANSSIRLASGGFADGIQPTALAEGTVEQTAWKIADASLSTLQIAQNLRAQLMASGFKIQFECETATCGGFDFRFAANILPEPDMHVDLGDFRYILAGRSGLAGGEQVAIMISRSSQDRFVQETRVSHGALAAPRFAENVNPQPLDPQSGVPQTLALPQQSAPPGSLVATLESGLPQVLEDLVFASGSSALQVGDYASLTTLAAWLAGHPKAVITLVGHTDTEGGLAGNITVSRARADSVRAYLITRLKVSPAQVQAEGVGYLSPRSSNDTPEGRQQNRRVEVMLTSTQ